MEHFRKILSPLTNSTKMAGDPDSVSSSSNNGIGLDLNLKVSVTEVPNNGSGVDGVLRNLIRDTLPRWTRSIVWLQLLRPDEPKPGQVELHLLGSRVAFAKYDLKMVKHPRKLPKGASSFFMKDFSRWILSHSLVHKQSNGVIDETPQVASDDPFDWLKLFPKAIPSPSIRYPEVFVCITFDGDVPGDVFRTKEALSAFLKGLKLNSRWGPPKIHVFSAVTGSVEVTSEKLGELSSLKLSAKVN